MSKLDDILKRMEGRQLSARALQDRRPVSWNPGEFRKDLLDKQATLRSQMSVKTKEIKAEPSKLLARKDVNDKSFNTPIIGNIKRAIDRPEDFNPGAFGKSWEDASLIEKGTAISAEAMHSIAHPLTDEGDGSFAKNVLRPDNILSNAREGLGIVTGKAIDITAESNPLVYGGRSLEIDLKMFGKDSWAEKVNSGTDIIEDATKGLLKEFVTMRSFGFVKPVVDYNNDGGFVEKTAEVVGGALGMITGKGAIQKVITEKVSIASMMNGVNILTKSTPKFLSTISKQESFYNFLAGSFAWQTYFQLDPDLKLDMSKRADAAVNGAFAQVLGTVTGKVGPKILTNKMWDANRMLQDKTFAGIDARSIAAFLSEAGVGATTAYGLTRLDGGTQEDAVSNAVAWGMISGVLGGGYRRRIEISPQEAFKIMKTASVNKLNKIGARLTPQSTPEQISSEVRRLQQTYHTDKPTGDAQVSKEINNAYNDIKSAQATLEALGINTNVQGPVERSSSIMELIKNIIGRVRGTGQEATAKKLEIELRGAKTTEEITAKLDGTINNDALKKEVDLVMKAAQLPAEAKTVEVVEKTKAEQYAETQIKKDAAKKIITDIHDLSINSKSDVVRNAAAEIKEIIKSTEESEVKITRLTTIVEGLSKHPVVETPDGGRRFLDYKNATGEFKMREAREKAFVAAGGSDSWSRAEHEAKMLEFFSKKQTSSAEKAEERKLISTVNKILKELNPKPLSAPVSPSPIQIPKESINPKYAKNINLDRMDISEEQKTVLRNAVDEISPEIDKELGKSITHEEILEVAAQYKVLKEADKSTSREKLVQKAVKDLKIRQNAARLSKEVAEMESNGQTDSISYKMKVKELSKNVIENIVAARAAGMALNARKILAQASKDVSVQDEMLDRIMKESPELRKLLGGDEKLKQLVEESSKVDWNNPDAVVKFYRKYVKPSAWEVLDEYRYSNMLISPKSHLRNTLWGIEQALVARPLVLLLTRPWSVAAFYKGVFGSLGAAKDNFIKSFTGSNYASAKQEGGKKPLIRTGYLPKFWSIGPRGMEAMDKFMSTIISGGESASLIRDGVSNDEAMEEAAKLAQRLLGRADYDGKNETGQGHLSSFLDSIGEWIEAGNKKIKIIKLFQPFVKTAIQISKIQLENSPVGFANTFKNSKDEHAKEKYAQAALGSVVTLIGALLAMDDRTSWKAPTNEDEKTKFFNSGRKPMSVNLPGIGWTPMTYFGPWAFALAIPAAAKYYYIDSPTATIDGDLEKAGRTALGLMNAFFQLTPMTDINSFFAAIGATTEIEFNKAWGEAAGQLVPWAGVEQYLADVFDPVNRKAKGAMESIQRRVIFWKDSLEPYVGPDDKASAKKWDDFLLPWAIGDPNQQWEDWFKQSLKDTQANRKASSYKADLKSQDAKERMNTRFGK